MVLCLCSYPAPCRCLGLLDTAHFQYFVLFCVFIYLRSTYFQKVSEIIHNKNIHMHIQCGQN